MEVSSDFFQRVLCLRSGSKSSTGFAIPWKGRTYLVMSKHLFERADIDRVEFYCENRWERVDRNVECAENGIDVATGQMPETFIPRSAVDLSGEGFRPYEDVYLIGFPLAPNLDSTRFNAGVPTASVVKGYFASLPGSASPRPGSFFVFGKIDEGFSGGPVVVMRDQGNPIVAGVVSHNLSVRTEKTLGDGQRVTVTNPANLVSVFSISLVTDLIDARFCR